jgi:hypothetical protein
MGNPLDSPVNNPVFLSDFMEKISKTALALGVTLSRFCPSVT